MPATRRLLHVLSRTRQRLDDLVLDPRLDADRESDQREHEEEHEHDEHGASA